MLDETLLSARGPLLLQGGAENVLSDDSVLHGFLIGDLRSRRTVKPVEIPQIQIAKKEPAKPLVTAT